MWFISGPVLKNTVILLKLENQADAWKAGSRNTIPHLLVHIAQPTTTLKPIYPNLKLLTRTGSRFQERPKRPYI